MDRICGLKTLDRVSVPIFSEGDFAIEMGDRDLEECRRRGRAGSKKERLGGLVFAGLSQFRKKSLGLRFFAEPNPCQTARVLRDAEQEDLIVARRLLAEDRVP